MGCAMLPTKKTKIVCTLGPASAAPGVLEHMMLAGMNVVRLNFAHGSRDDHLAAIVATRSAAQATDRCVTIIGDLPGPKIRIGPLNGDHVVLERGQEFTLCADSLVGDGSRATLDMPHLVEVIGPGDRIFVNDGFVELRVEERLGAEVRCRVAVGGDLRSRSGVNIPGIDLGVDAFTSSDREHLGFAADQRLDGVSQSFVQDAGDIEVVREEARRLGYEPMVIAKIERSQAVQNIEPIVDAADAIMVARGDLGVETPIESIALTQKKLIRLANLKSKPVITATHMLESMIDHRRPTRAEATDVANAILDGSDCVMLSAETAIGRYPVECVSVMARIAQATEAEVPFGSVADELESARAEGILGLRDLVSLAVYHSAKEMEPIAILCPTLSGATARYLSRFRFPSWIVAVSPDERTCSKLQLSYGVLPQREAERPASWERYAREWLAECGTTEGFALLTQGSGTAFDGGINKIGFVDLAKPPADVKPW